MQFIRYAHVWLDFMGWNYGISLGMHLSWQGFRLDMHFLFWVLSVGYRIPLYRSSSGRVFAASNSFDAAMRTQRFRKDSYQHHKVRK